MSQTDAVMDWPLYPIDKIIGYFTDTVTVPAPTAVSGPTTVTTAYPHGFGDSTYFQGIYTDQFGVRWSDFGAMQPKNPGATPTFQTLDLSATVDTTNLNVTAKNYYDVVNSVGVSRTCTYKVYLLAKNSMPLPLEALPMPTNTQYDSRLNYQKIALQGTATLNVAAGTASGVTVNHNLGVVPSARVFMFLAASPTVCRMLGTTIDAILG